MRFLNKFLFTKNFLRANKNSPNERNRIAYLISLTLLFSYAELIIPRFVPFFRLGLSNIAVLSALNLSFPSFFVLTVFKAAATSLMAGTLFSPFVVISLFQSVLSGIFMFAIFRLNNFFQKKLFSLYGISVLGSSLSAAVQISLSAIYLGGGTFMVLGPMLIFNAASGILTAFLAQFLEIPDTAPILGGGSLPLGRTPLRPTPSNGSRFRRGSTKTRSKRCATRVLSTPPSLPTLNARLKKSSRFFNIIKILAVLSLSATVFFIDSIPVLVAFFALSLLIQFLCGRKIMVLPHVFLWVFVIFSTLLVPSGKVFFNAGNFSVTQGALFNGISKALKLSAASAFSQCAANLKVPKQTLLGITLLYYRGLLNILKTSPGNIFQRLKTTLCTTELPAE